MMLDRVAPSAAAAADTLYISIVVLLPHLLFNLSLHLDVVCVRPSTLLSSLICRIEYLSLIYIVFKLCTSNGKHQKKMFLIGSKFRNIAISLVSVIYL